MFYIIKYVCKPDFHWIVLLGEKEARSTSSKYLECDNTYSSTYPYPWKNGFEEEQNLLLESFLLSPIDKTARLDSPEDQGKGKVLPRQVLLFKEYNVFQG